MAVAYCHKVENSNTYLAKGVWILFKWALFKTDIFWIAKGQLIRTVCHSSRKFLYLVSRVWPVMTVFNPTIVPNCTNKMSFV